MERKDILIPYTPASSGEDAEEQYLLHRLRRRFSHSEKEGSFMMFAAQQVAKLAQVNLKAASRLNSTLEQGFEKVDQGQRRIHQALIGQTEVIEAGFDKVSLSIDVQTAQQAIDAKAQQEAIEKTRGAIEHQTEAVSQGFAQLAARVDMGMSGLLAQFELQRSEMQEGLKKIENLFGLLVVSKS